MSPQSFAQDLEPTMKDYGCFQQKNCQLDVQFAITAPGYKPELFCEFTGSTLQPQGQAHNSPFASGDPDVCLIWMCAGNWNVSLMHFGLIAFWGFSPTAYF